jgi:hypothetical protein
MGDRRKMAGDIARMVMETLGDNAPGLIMVVVANERDDTPGYIEVDGAVQGVQAHTPYGADKLKELAQHLNEQVRAATRKLGDGRVIPRDDLDLPGPRGKS